MREMDNRSQSPGVGMTGWWTDKFGRIQGYREVARDKEASVVRSHEGVWVRDNGTRTVL